MYINLLYFGYHTFEHVALFVIHSGQVLPVNQFGVHTCLVHPLTHVMVLEIPVH